MKSNVVPMTRTVLFRRLLKMLLRHLLMLARPAAVAGVIVGVWYQLHRHHIHFSAEDESILTGTVLPIIGMAYSIIAGLVLNTAWKEFKIIEDCVRCKDRTRFLRYRDVRIPPTIHLLLGTMSLIIIGIIVTLNYTTTITAVIAVASVSFVLMLYGEVAIDLDNPAKGAWYTERVPREWLDAKAPTRFNGKGGSDVTSMAD